MPEKRVVRTVYGVGGYDLTKPNNNIIEEITAEISDEELYQEQLAQEFNDIHIQAILALNNWSSLTTRQKDTILKNLVKWALWKDGWLHSGTLT